LSYARKVCGLAEALGGIRDSRQRPRISTARAVRAIFAMFMTRLGSLNAVDVSRPSRFWDSWIGGALPSGDSLGRISATLDLETVREANWTILQRLKRCKALAAPAHGLVPLIIDGHESHATYRRHCKGCLRRTVGSKDGERIQYYHRHVTAWLGTGAFGVLLDAEPQRAGEDEVEAALRLLDRIYRRWPRAFDVVCGDALYTDPRIYGWAAGKRGKYVLTVLKDERRDLLKDVSGLVQVVSPVETTKGKTHRRCWDLEGLTSWPQVGRPVRVVRSLESTPVRRQGTGEVEEQVSRWIWVTTLPRDRARVDVVVDLGHARWDIENRGFNETTTRWAADHVYKHDPTAISAFGILCMIAYNVFHAFFWRNLKPCFRARITMVHLSKMLASTIYSELPQAACLSP